MPQDRNPLMNGASTITTDSVWWSATCIAIEVVCTMFDVWWKAIACFVTIAIANAGTFSSAFHAQVGDRSILSTSGWLVFLLGSCLPLGAIFYSAAKAGYVDDGIWLAVVLGCLFIIRLSVELGALGEAILGARREDME